jgi:hypothetical protein
MKQQKASRTALVPLARATSATRGAWGNYRDEILMQERPGLSID